MNRSTRIAVGVAAAALTAASVAPGSATAAEAGFESGAESRAPAGAKAYGLLTNGALVTFALDDPTDINRFGRLSGFAEDDEGIVGMDVRPADGRLYAIGDGGGVYTVRLKDATLRKVGEIDTGGIIGGGLDGRRFGVDFNPAADALRIVSDTGQNLRLTFADGEVATFNDTDLSTPPTAGTTEGVTAAAYTNNDDSDVTGTTLLVVNTAFDQVLTQAPANNGTLSAVGSLRKGFGPDASFDVYTRLRGGVASDNAGYAVLMQNGVRALHRVDLTTGEATRVGAFKPNAQVTDMAVRLPAGAIPSD